MIKSHYMLETSIYLFHYDNYLWLFGWLSEIKFIFCLYVLVCVCDREFVCVCHVYVYVLKYGSLVYARWIFQWLFLILFAWKP